MILTYCVLHVKQAILSRLAHPGHVVEDPEDRADRHISQPATSHEALIEVSIPVQHQIGGQGGCVLALVY
jgi:hypothetical protein